MLRCKASYVEICAIDDVKLVGNSLVAWPAALRNCRRIPHPLRETKAFLRDKILCKESNGHVGNVQNNLEIGPYKGKHVALFRASDAVLDCGQGTIIDFPAWKALREMLATNKPEVPLTVKLLLRLAGDAEEEVAAGLAEEVVPAAAVPAQRPARPAPTDKVGAGGAAKGSDASGGWPGESKRARLAKEEAAEVDPSAWLGTELGEYPNAIRLVSSTSSNNYSQLLEEAATATAVAYDVQWSPDFEEGSDNPIALLQLAFPSSGNTYVMQLPLLKFDIPLEVKNLFESSAIMVAGFAATEIDVHKFDITGVKVDTGSLFDVQPWCEAEMGENQSVLQGWRVGLKRAAACVLDYDMDKTCTVASSNWEREELTTAQVEYGAMDVWVALRLFQRLLPVYGEGVA